MEWILTLHLHVMNAKTAGEAKSEYFKYVGFSSKADCERAAEAASEVFMLRDGVHNGLASECKQRVDTRHSSGINE